MVLVAATALDLEGRRKELEEQREQEITKFDEDRKELEMEKEALAQRKAELEKQLQRSRVLREPGSTDSRNEAVTSSGSTAVEQVRDGGQQGRFHE